MASYLDSLPNEIIETIFSNSRLSVQDVCNAAQCCHRLNRALIFSNKVWRNKFIQKWPGLEKVLASLGPDNWRSVFMQRFNCHKAISKLICEMSSKFYLKDEFSHSELAPFLCLMDEHSYSYYFIMHELKMIINQLPENECLTHKYYAEKVIRFIQQEYLKKEWQKFIELPESSQLLEVAATIVAQWCQPIEEVHYDEIAKSFDKIAETVKERLFENNPNHPIFKTTPQEFKLWRNKNIEGNQWNPIHSQQVITAICSVLFGESELGFHGNNEMYYSAENSFIDKVLQSKRGIPITLSIVFESVARRVGIKCEPVSFPAHFLLRWRETYGDASSPYYYIDVFNGGEFLTKRSCPRYSPNAPCPMKGMNIAAASPVQVVERMANNLEVAGRQRSQMNGRGTLLRSALELLHLVNPLDMTCILYLARIYMLYNMDLSGLLEAIKKVQSELNPHAQEQAKHLIQMLNVYEQHEQHSMNYGPNVIMPKRRIYDVDYAIGMVMHHRLYNYICVIFGWDPKCAETQEWINQMEVHTLSKRDQQPFYNVLVEDGSTRYAAQENLEVALEPRPVRHVEVGRYFESFCGTHYVPNKEKESEYPEDYIVRSQFLEKLFK